MTHHTGSDEGLSEVEHDAAFATIERLVAEAHERGYSLDALLTQTYAAAAAPDALRERVEALADEWAETDWNATPHLGCLGMYRHCAELLRAALAERPTDGAGT